MEEAAGSEVEGDNLVSFLGDFLKPTRRFHFPQIL